MMLQVPWAALWTAAAAATAGDEPGGAAQRQQQQTPSGKELKQRWKRLVKRQVCRDPDVASCGVCRWCWADQQPAGQFQTLRTERVLVGSQQVSKAASSEDSRRRPSSIPLPQAAPEDGWFRIPLSGEPPAQLALAARAAFADAAAPAVSVAAAAAAAESANGLQNAHAHGAQAHGSCAHGGCGHAHGPQEPGAANGAATGGAANDTAAAAAHAGGGKLANKKGRRRAGEAAVAIVAPSAANVLRLLTALRLQRLARCTAVLRCLDAV